MLRTTQERMMEVIASQFGYATPTDSGRDGAPRDVLWCPPEIGPRRRAEQSSRLERDPDINMPFMSFWRTAVRENKGRMNIPLAVDGAPIDDNYTRRYKLRPVFVVFQIEHWAKKHVDHEGAIENWFTWTMPLPELVVTDANGVVFQMPVTVIDPQDNSRIQEIYDIGELYRETFTMTVSGYIVGDTGADSYTPIDTIKWKIWDYSATGETTDAVGIKEVDIVQS